MSKYGKFHSACNASGQRYTNYSGAGRPDETNTMQCPVCGKPVKLRALYPAARHQPARCFVLIPYHNARHGITQPQPKQEGGAA